MSLDLPPAHHSMMLPANKLKNARRRAERARDGRVIVTCPASRHVMLMADALAAGRKDPMMEAEPEHCATALYSVLESLWTARAEVMQLQQEKQT